MFSTIAGYFIDLKMKLMGIGLALMVFAGWILKLKSDARSEGESRYRQKLDKEVRKVEDDWKKIDNSPGDVDAALSRLRSRAPGGRDRT